MTKSNAAQAAATDKLVPFQQIFLTGGSGYVGRNLIRHFAACGVAIKALARSDKSAELVRSLGATQVRGELFDDALSEAMAGCDALIHAAADTDHGPATDRQRRVNEDGTRAVMEAAHRAGIRKVIHLSTESVLATGRALVNVDESTPLPLKPAGGYSRTKAAAERIALAANADNFAVVVLRPRFVWGRDDTTALPAITEAVKSGKFAWISGGTYLTSTTHIGNLCNAVELALAHGRGGEVYFVSDGAPVAFRTIVSGLLDTQGLQIPDKSVPRAVVRTVAIIGDILAAISVGRIVPPLTRQAYATSAVEVSLDIGKARRELGYEPVISREEGLAELHALQH
ncbi:NAD-dependent epimerase/dehydratase family protein [Rhizobium sp. S95]|uniref:NAD-dependent epimerase/dehydratase family protein n=1 Tax=Ciceribacter sichuanensis TaxID=2949647 RepID=A0AAJ1C017_9HYPH|nr:MULTISPECIES: NAD-dependent epimerase/dehydratase family protein [unclassified Ciceribacter]MCM2397844.1 NAD-dependent epimerase/dehydratase family protein [Ciceribacter sp. S95]MCO5959350.1 NAD-dependent epimerase/dehydratase family protein [Ciceribacter sp. S101]